MLARPRHPNKEIEAVVQNAEALGWRWSKLTGHGWGELLCPLVDRDGCRVFVYSTPRNPEAAARSYARAVARCECVKEKKMKVHEFTIIASGLHPDTDDVANIFYEAGCDDAAVSFQKGVLILDFDRAAQSFSAAVISAFADVLKTGAKVERFEPDHLVSLADIARRTGLSRGALTNYHQGERAENFPTPVARVTSESPLWDWCEVATWMHARDKIGRDEVVQAHIVKEANLVIATSSHEPDHFFERMTERVRLLEAA